jgi:hypothetical protein
MVHYHPTCFSAPNFTSAANSNAIVTAQPSRERLLFGFSCVTWFGIGFDPPVYQLCSTGIPRTLSRKQKAHSRLVSGLQRKLLNYCGSKNTLQMC